MKHKNAFIIDEIIKDVDIAAVSETELILRNDVGVLLVDTQKLPHISGNGRINTVVSCGMNEKDTLTFSSIDNDRGVLCVQRDIFCGKIALECGEFPVNYDSNLPIWHNIVLGFCDIVAREL